MRLAALNVVMAICVGTCAGDFPQFQARRLEHNPLITPEMFAEAGVPDDGKNINGPSLIRIPDWIAPEQRADAKAQYYLYFADHGGEYIRMAWAEKVAGPYHLYKPGEGVLSLHNDRSIKRPVGKGRLLPVHKDLMIGGHVASPDVHVDDANKRIVMFFHGQEESPGDEGRFEFTHPDGRIWSRKRPQVTFVGINRNGLDFNEGIKLWHFKRPYLRAFQVDGQWFGSTFMWLWRAEPPDDPFGQWHRSGQLSPAPGRHTAARVGPDGIVTLFGSCWGEAPEHITYVSIKGIGKVKPSGYEQSRRFSLLKPEKAWEGANLPLKTSERGKAPGPVNQLRDPAYFRDKDGSEYILYSVAGESGIAIARLLPTAP
jgi:hypothetical protein